MPDAKHAGRRHVPYLGVVYTAPPDEEVVLMAVAARLDEARAVLRAVTADARTAVTAAATAGLSDRAIARALGVHRRTVRNWRTADDDGDAL